MCVNMAKTIKEERLRWVLPIVQKEIRLVDAVKVCPYGQRSLERWVSSYKEYGALGLEPRSTKPKTNPKETPIRIKERIVELRQEKKKCAFKLANDLEKEGIKLDVRTIGKILKKEGLTRKYRIRKLKYKYIKVTPAKGELIEIDIKYVPKTLNGKKYYQFTAIDSASRWRYLAVYDNMGNNETVNFLNKVIEVAPFKIRAIKTDNGACSTNRYVGYRKSTDPLDPKLHLLDLECQRLNIIHYLIDPGKPAQNGKVERSHRSDQETFYDQVEFNTVEELRYKLKLWNMYYNDLQHCGLNNLSPNQMLKILSD